MSRIRSSLALLLFTAGALLAADFPIQTVDGLGRPLSEVKIDFTCQAATNRATAHLQSDQAGMAHLAMDELHCDPANPKFGFASVAKKGYVVSPSANLSSRYVLLREFGEKELASVLKLNGDAFEQGVRGLLAGQEVESLVKLGHLEKTAFQFEGRFRPVLLGLVSDAYVAGRARDVLALIGRPEDLRMIARLAPPAAAGPAYDRCQSWIVAELVHSDDESEWSLLRDCALRAVEEYGDAPAIQSLRLNGSSRSQAILEEAQEEKSQTPSIRDALSYVQLRPLPLEDADLGALEKRVASSLTKADHSRVGRPLFNDSGDHALVDFTLSRPWERLVYTATFHKANSVWTLRGVRVTARQVTVE